MVQDAAGPRLCLVDVGSRGGLQPKWQPYINEIQAIMFEPDETEATKLRDRLRPDSPHLVVGQGLSDVVGLHRFHVAVNPLVSSLLPPNSEFLAGYEIRPHFKLKSEIDIPCTRYDVLYHEGLVPAPDAIKIDVQGFEYQVLLGFGSLLQNCLGVELEAHFYPLYRGQRLLHDIISLLGNYDFVLRTLQHSSQFDGDLVEVNAFFTKPRFTVRRLSPVQRQKFDLLTKVWGLAPYRL